MPSEHGVSTRRAIVRGMPTRAGRRVLVVNDDLRLAQSVRRLLSETGYDTRVAYDGQAGLAALAQEPADVMLLDLIMPGLDGWAVLERLATQTSETRPIVLVWSVAGEPDFARARRLGADECLPRETTGPAQLIDAIDHAIEQLPPRS